MGRGSGPAVGSTLARRVRVSSSPASCPRAGSIPLVAAGHEIVQRDGDEPWPARRARAPRPVTSTRSSASSPIAIDADGPAGRRAAAAGRRQRGRGLRQHRRRHRLRARDRGLQHARGARRDHRRSRLPPAARGGAADIRCRGRPPRRAAGPGFHIGDFLGVDVHGATLGCRRLRPHRPGGRAPRRRDSAWRCCTTRATTPASPGGSADLDDLLPRVDFVSLHVPAERRDAWADRRPSARAHEAVSGVGEHGARSGRRRGGAGRSRSRTARSSLPGSTSTSASPTVHPRLLAAPHAVLLPHIGSAIGRHAPTHGAAGGRGCGRGAAPGSGLPTWWSPESRGDAGGPAVGWCEWRRERDLNPRGSYHPLLA